MFLEINNKDFINTDNIAYLFISSQFFEYTYYGNSDIIENDYKFISKEKLKESFNSSPFNFIGLSCDEGDVYYLNPKAITNIEYCDEETTICFVNDKKPLSIKTKKEVFEEVFEKIIEDLNKDFKNSIYVDHF